MIRVAVENDLPLLCDLLRSHNSYMGAIVTEDTVSDFCNQFLSGLESKNGVEHIQVMVTDDSGNILATARQVFLVRYNRNWIFSGLITRSSTFLFSPTENGVAEITNYFIDRAESRGFYAYSFIMLAGKSWNNRTISMRDKVEILHRYEYYDEAYIPKNTLPDVERYKNMMGYKSWNSDLIIRTGMLKNEYRNKEILITK